MSLKIGHPEEVAMTQADRLLYYGVRVYASNLDALRTDRVRGTLSTGLRGDVERLVGHCGDKPVREVEAEVHHPGGGRPRGRVDHAQSSGRYVGPGHRHERQAKPGERYGHIAQVRPDC